MNYYFIAKRVGLGLGLVLLVLTLIFSGLHLVPGDPALLLLSSGESSAGVSPEAVARVRGELGLDEPLWAQYVHFLTGVVTGDLGRSFYSGEAVSASIGSRLPRTLELVVFATLLSMIVGIPLGALAAYKRGVIDSVVTFFASTGLAVPVFVSGTVLILVFSILFGWLPAGGFVSWQQDPIAHLERLILPAISLALSFAAIIARMTRSAVLETMGQDWVRTAKSFGLGRFQVFRRHVLRNSLTPVVTVIGLGAGMLLGSTVLAEQVFNYPGLSSLLILAVSRRDYSVVQGIVIVIAMLFIFINIVVDVVYGLLDPRVRR